MRVRYLYWLGWFLTRVIGILLFRIKVSGREHVPEEGGFILALNHISYYDPPLAGSFIRREVFFFTKKELFRIPLFGALLRRLNTLPVSRGAIDRKALDLAVGVIREGFGLTIFPEGTRSKTGNFLLPRAGVGMIAVQAECPIVVGYLHGSNKLSDCFLGRERLRIIIGEPFSVEWVKSFPPKKESYQEIATAVMNRIGELRKQAVAVKGE